MVNGIHHITAFAGDAQANIDFYTCALGLRLVKQTVNFDDPNTYHFYFGDAVGTPGTIMTFFPWSSHGKPGRAGTGQVVATAFDVPRNSIVYWRDRLRSLGLGIHSPAERFDETVLLVSDADGLEVELVGSDDTGDGEPWEAGGVPAEHAIRRIGGATLLVADGGPTGELVQGVMGFERVGSEGRRTRYRTGESRVDIVTAPDRDRGEMGVGAVHHVAWRVASDDEQIAAAYVLRGAGLRVTDVRDRQYFRSIYFREPGGVLFEIATDPPGFGIDEEGETLGESLKLPAWLEANRDSIEAQLPSVKVRT